MGVLYRRLFRKLWAVTSLKWNLVVVVVVWREFLWGAIAGAFGEGMMHPIDTIKTRIQSQAILTGSQV